MTAGGSGLRRFGVVLAGVLGAVGVVAAAGASHAGDERILGALSLVALTHAPTVLALALFGAAGRLAQAALLFIGLGALLFCADLGFRHFAGGALFAMLAPIGGTAMIVGWLALAASAWTGLVRE